MNNYRVYDRTGGGVTQDISAVSLEDAIEKGRDWIEDGEWSGCREDGDIIRLGITLDACVRKITHDVGGDDITEEQDAHDCSGSYSDPEPECEEGGGDDDGGHDWQSPHELVGGIDDNPGVWATGGTSMRFATVCGRCGCYRTENRVGCQRNADDADATVEYRDADDDSKAWLKQYHSDDNWLPDWLAIYLGISPTVKYTEGEAKEWVADHADDDDLNKEDLEHVFAAIIGRRAEDHDRSDGLWSLVCQLAND